MVLQAALVEPAVMGTVCELKIFFPIPFFALFFASFLAYHVGRVQACRSSRVCQDMTVLQCSLSASLAYIERGPLLVHDYHRSKSHSIYNHLQYQQADFVELSKYIHHCGDSHLPFHILHLRSGVRTPARNFNQGLICHPFSTV